MYRFERFAHTDINPLPQLFRAEVRIVDHAKKNALQKSLLQQITSTGPNERLEDKLNAMNINYPDASNRALMMPDIGKSNNVLFEM